MSNLVAVFANNDSTVLALPLSNVATTATLSSGTGALFPSPAAGEFFPLTLTPSGGGSSPMEITWCTSRTGDVVTLLRAQEGTSALAWNAGDVISNLITAAVMRLFPQPARIRCRADLNLYVSATGSDSNDGLSPGTAFATYNKAYNTLLSDYDGNGFAAIINAVAGTITNGLTANVPLVGFLGLTLLGSPVTPANCFINVTNANCVYVNCNQNLLVDGFKLQATGGIPNGFGVYGNNGARITCQNITGESFTNSIFRSTAGATVNIATGIIVDNNATMASVAEIEANGVMSMDGAHIDVGTSVTVSIAFVFAGNGGYLEAIATVFTGNTPTGPKYIVNSNGVINTSGAGINYFPGSVAGATATGGQYT